MEQKVDVPESVEAAQAELEQLAAALNAIEAVKARFAFLSGWLAAQQPVVATQGRGRKA